MITSSFNIPSGIWTSVKDSFQLDPAYVHLALAMLTPHPKPVRDAIALHRKGFDSNPALYFRNKDQYEQHVLLCAASYLITQPEQIALTESTTMGLAVVYTGFQMEEGDEILTSVHEHYAALETLRFKEKKEKIRIKHITLYEDAQNATEEDILRRILEHITDKTRLLALTWVHSCTGVKLPIRKIADVLASCNAARREGEKIFFAVDGLHGFGVEEIGIEDLGCDFFIAGCHKWLFGPRGTGLIWGSLKGWEKIIPIMTSFKAEAFWPWFNKKKPDDSCPKAWLCTPGGFQAYEHRWALGEAFNFHLLIGKKAISDRIHSMNSYCKEQMRHVPRVRLYTPDEVDLSSGMICFEVEGMDPAVVVEKFLERNIIIGQTPYCHTLCRFTPGILNDWTDLDRALSVLRDLS